MLRFYLKAINNKPIFFIATVLHLRYICLDLKPYKMKIIHKVLPILALALYSCEPVDPTNPNEEELITTFTVELVGSTSSATLSYVDMDGDGGSAPVISVDSLE